MEGENGGKGGRKEKQWKIRGNGGRLGRKGGGGRRGRGVGD